MGDERVHLGNTRSSSRGTVSLLGRLVLAPPTTGCTNRRAGGRYHRSDLLFLSCGRPRPSVLGRLSFRNAGPAPLLHILGEGYCYSRHLDVQDPGSTSHCLPYRLELGFHGFFCGFSDSTLLLGWLHRRIFMLRIPLAKTFPRLGPTDLLLPG